MQTTHGYRLSRGPSVSWSWRRRGRTQCPPSSPIGVCPLCRSPRRSALEREREMKVLSPLGELEQDILHKAPLERSLDGKTVGVIQLVGASSLFTERII